MPLVIATPPTSAAVRPVLTLDLLLREGGEQSARDGEGSQETQEARRVPLVERVLARVSKRFGSMSDLREPREQRRRWRQNARTAHSRHRRL
jgi:hypothetical protein